MGKKVESSLNLSSTGMENMQHAMCLYGFDEDRNAFLFKNSSSEETTIKVPLASGQENV